MSEALSRSSSSTALRPSSVRTGMPESTSLSKYVGINLKAMTRQTRGPTSDPPTYSSPFRFRSLASSRCFCSSASLCLVASPYSLLRSLVVTFSHNFRLSLGSCFSRGRTTLGTVCSFSRSTSVWGSAVDGTDRLEPEGLRRHRMRFRQQPSRKATTRD